MRTYEGKFSVQEPSSRGKGIGDGTYEGLLNTFVGMTEGPGEIRPYRKDKRDEKKGKTKSAIMSCVRQEGPE